jgi:hypothetical protein
MIAELKETIFERRDLDLSRKLNPTQTWDITH